MKKLYEASNALEAHMILNLLEQQGLHGRVDGEYLQGGVGELPATGLVKVMVDEGDFIAAKQIINQWESTQPATEVQKRPKNHFLYLLIGLLVGVLCTYAFYRAPIEVDGVDHNKDGKLDEKWTFASNGQMLRIEADRNFDGQNDYLVHYGRTGTVESTEQDDDLDGIYETLTHYRHGNPHLIEIDTDKDSFKDYKTNYKNGIVFSSEYIYPTTGYPEKIEYFKLGKLSYSEIDTDHDGKMDQRKRYNGLGEVVSVESINK